MKNNFTNWMGSLFKPKKKGSCCDCIESLHLVIDGEATKDQEDHFMSHIDDCQPCYKSFELEKSVKELLQTKIDKKSCPPQVIENIRAKLGQKV
jgi:anti-sigma factor (TIGR02949 family)